MYKYHLFFGENNYLSLKQLQEVRARFVTKFSATSVETIDCEEKNENIAKIIDESLSVRTLFSEKKLLVLKNIFSLKDEPSIKLIAEAVKNKDQEDLFILFWNRDKPDKRSKIYRLLNSCRNKEVKFHESFLLKDTHLKDWVGNYLKSAGKTVNLAVMETLRERLEGLPLWSVANYLDILICVSEVEIVAEDVTTYIPSRFEMDNFKVTDSILAKNSAYVFKNIMPLLLARTPNHEEAVMFLGALNWFNRTLIQLKYGSVSGIKPFVVQKMRPYVNNFSEELLISIVHQNCELDEKIKLSKYLPTWAIEKTVWNLLQ